MICSIAHVDDALLQYLQVSLLLTVAAAEAQLKHICPCASVITSFNLAAVTKKGLVPRKKKGHC